MFIPLSTCLVFNEFVRRINIVTRRASGTCTDDIFYTNLYINRIEIFSIQNLISDITITNLNTKINNIFGNKNILTKIS